MRLAVFYPWQEGSGGDPAYFRHLCNALARQGTSSVVLCRSGPHKHAEPLVEARYPQGRAPFMLSDLADLHRFLKAERRSLDALVMVGCFSPFNAGAALLARWHGVPYIVSPEGTIAPAAFTHGRRYTKRVYWHLIERPLLSGASAVRVLSDFEESCLRTMGIRTPMFVAREGPEHDALAAFPDYRRERREGRHFVFVGRLDIWQKALDYVVVGFADALRRSGKDLRLTLAGPPLPGAERHLRDLFAREGLVEGRDVHLRPAVYGTAKWDLLRSADVFLHPSRNEGIPRSVVEALTMGIPVIVTAATNLGSVVERAGAGWQVEPTVDGVSCGILAAVTAGDLEVRASSAARLARTDLSWDAIALAFLGPLPALLHRNGAAP